jgi:hypothetical protein
MAEPERRRRRVRHSGWSAIEREAPRRAAEVDSPEPAASAETVRSVGRVSSAETPPVHDPESESGARPGGDDQTERGLRGLIGAGASQVSPGAALRARDAARPTDADLAAAEAGLVIVRRGWVPRTPLTR